ncbi:MAG: DUF885 domain-containing protein [Gammaproteobacteria bacterium]|nr:DUF885 domain-containing protein [Gammaproteobacteria bacterium]MBU2178958.1 DUF885 domain-containing protein [Gammaproteobacteria bacterium]MBU2279168.1 DUF885 domain-containing protein [Gammaproteobacteria bacterium]
MKHKLWLVLYCSTLVACASSKVDPNKDFDVFANAIWQKAENIVRYDSEELPDMSESTLAAANQQRQQLITELAAVDVKTLSEQNQINHNILMYRLQNQVDEYKYGDRYMPLTAESGFHSDLTFMVSGSQIKTLGDAEKYLKKISSVPRYMAQQTELMRQGIRQGYTQPKAVFTGYEQGILSFIQTDIDQSVFFRPFLKPVASIPETQWQALQTQARTIISQQIQPAYQQYYDFFVSEYLPAARDNIAANSLPDGAAFYQNRLEHYTTLKMTPAEVHQIGLQEVARIRAEMAQVIKQTGFKGTFAEFIQFLRTDKQFYVTTPDQLLKEASFIAKKIDAQLPTLFNTLPRTPYGVEAVPAEIAPKYTTGRYSGGREPGAAGFYWVNTYALDRRPLYELEALTLHEAVPGHHLQVALANEQANLPSYRRSFYTSAFGEGWGLYSEFLGLEVGFYQDPYSNFGRLTYEMWRACRLVVDTGMHTMGWSRQQAIDFLASNTALSMHNVTTEVDRYISWPAQALSYKLGELTIKRLRAEAEKALGNKFDVRQFHDVVLQNGSLPLPVLEQQIAKYIRQQQAK